MKNRNNINIEILKTVLVVVLVFISVSTIAKSNGELKKYTQVTDKEVLIESSTGEKILFSAYDNYSIGITYFKENEEVELISPSKIIDHDEFAGSIYVEEIDELMQITTTTSDGLMIKINTSKFGFTVFDKTNNSQLVLEEGLTAMIVSKNQKKFLDEDFGKGETLVAKLGN